MSIKRGGPDRRCQPGFRDTVAPGRLPSHALGVVRSLTGRYAFGVLRLELDRNVRFGGGGGSPPAQVRGELPPVLDCIDECAPQGVCPTRRTYLPVQVKALQRLVEV